ncbi:MAG: DMT family transporter [Rhodobacteraceae bacterium]|jgi:drug/metabolite transporter (DMT)-like permease|nr:EamA family transporter [Marinovum sp.]MBT3651158.1 DMT family transporter [Paracoccaceae bacterium]MBT4230426.1 DMT family transporter [Paracoccaceae bacterium]MBT4952896.1 DMT family transporter [Paracoccaceae bacterium]MBT5317884.1 DMT family transporter [Paracoccaceae bacterium]
MMRLGPMDWGLLVLLSLLWGGSFLCVGIAVQELPVLTIIALRVSLAALVLWGIALFSGHQLPRGRKTWQAFLALGLLNNVIPFGLIVFGQQTIGAGLAAILNATTPLWTVLIAALFLADERFSKQKLFGVLLGLVGVIVMVGPDSLAGISRNLGAQLAVLGATLSYAFASVFGRRFAAAKISPLHTALGQVTASSFILVPLALMIDTPWASALPSQATIFAILGLAVLSTAGGYLLFFNILERAGATNVSLVTLLIPPSAIAMGMLFLEETLQGIHFIGLALIILGLLSLQGRLFRLSRPKQAD